MVWWNAADETWGWGPRGGAAISVLERGIDIPGADESSMEVVIMRLGGRFDGGSGEGAAGEAGDGVVGLTEGAALRMR